MLIIIVGLPRTGTTIVYKILYEALKQLSSSALCLYEPLTPHIAANVHEVTQITDHEIKDLHTDYPLLPREVLDYLASNADWYYRYDPRCYTQYYVFARKFLEMLLSLGKPVLVKDLYLPLFLEDLVRELGDKVKVIATWRSFESWARAIYRWSPRTLRVRKSISKIRRAGLSYILRRATRLVNVVKWWVYRIPPPYLHGLRPYLVHIGRLRLPVRKCDLEYLYKYWYLPRIWDLEKRYDIFLVRLEELQEEPEKVVCKLSRFLNIEIPLSVTRHVRKI